LYEKRGCASAESTEGLISGDEDAIWKGEKEVRGYMPLQELRYVGVGTNDYTVTNRHPQHGNLGHVELLE
jgi:hypothetical protein